MVCNFRTNNDDCIRIKKTLAMKAFSNNFLTAIHFKTKKINFKKIIDSILLTARRASTAKRQLPFIIWAIVKVID